ncbi:phosphatase PAP2 family protein [Treponema sp.]|uniref:phosphatase PAP2 family protein n=1 Tax=Treponema sp. TaxID=166 RepID=UPI0025F264D8|nr:phosphatase PAP2 family protein [Treponema sp.]MCR5217817.1 phosphatase PAP2 family protein [Treponema sp.]
MVKKILSLLAFSLFSLSFLTAEIPFEKDALADGLILGGGAAVFAGGMLMDEYVDFDYPENLDKDDVNVFDSWCIQDFDKAFGYAGNISYGAGVLLFPEILFSASYLNDSIKGQELVTIGLMYVESFLYTKGTINIIKNIVQRPRPYSYYGDVDYFDESVKDRYCSFPSGHTSDAFMSAAFTTYVFHECFPDSKWCLPVGIASYTIATSTAAFRMMSGNHFFTDVLAAAGIGTFYGLGIPYLHKVIYKKKTAESQRAKFEVTPLPSGFNFTLRF